MNGRQAWQKKLCGLHVSAKSSEEKKEDEIWPFFFPDYLWNMVMVIAGPADSGGMQKHKAKSCQKEAKCRDGKWCGSRGASGAVLCSSMDQASLHFHLCTHHFTRCCIGGNGLQLSTACMLWPPAWVTRELKGSAKFGKLPIECPIDILFRVPLKNLCRLLWSDKSTNLHLTQKRTQLMKLNIACSLGPLEILIYIQ
jgi:hypothetical protein